MTEVSLLDRLLSLTALPNLHPALVHFPIALAAAALLFDAALLASRRLRALDPAAAALWVLAAAGAGAAYLAGESAAEGLSTLTPAAETTLAQHEDAARITLIALGVLGLLRVALVWRDRRPAAPRRDVVRVAAIVAALGVQALVLRTADLGGALVYRHAVAVGPVEATAMASAPEPVATAEPTPPEHLAASQAPERAALERLADGTLVWTPTRSDEAALAEALEPLGEAVVGVAPPAGGPGIGIGGSGLLLLPGQWRDARLEVRLDLSDFHGELALAQGVGDAFNFGELAVTNEGVVSLRSRREVRSVILDEDALALPAGPWTVAFSVVGRHWRGFVNGESVLHGHAQLRAPARVGLVLDGEGSVRIESVRIQPLEDERNGSSSSTSP